MLTQFNYVSLKHSPRRQKALIIPILRVCLTITLKLISKQPRNCDSVMLENYLDDKFQ